MLQLVIGAEYFLRRELLQGTEQQEAPSDGIMDDYFNNGIHANQQDNPYDSSFSTSQPQDDGGGGSSSHSRGRTILTILYLCVLGLCFIIPVFYYFRLHCFEESARRELEMDFATALEQSEQHREESRAARRKYIEERRARIVQLFVPVRMILKKENFPHLVDPENAPPLSRTSSFNRVPELDLELNKRVGESKCDESATMTSDDILSPYTTDEEDDDGEQDSQFVRIRSLNNNNQNVKESDIESGTMEPKPIETNCNNTEIIHQHSSENKTTMAPAAANKEKEELNPYGDEDTFYIRIPKPGLPTGGTSLFFSDPTNRKDNSDHKEETLEMRLAPGLCTICLSNYKVGSDIVWSSNEACDHHFHANCIEKWLMKQREGPLCPCCRRDFIVDPLDLLEEEGEGAPVFQWDPSFMGSMEESSMMIGVRDQNADNNINDIDVETTDNHNQGVESDIDNDAPGHQVTNEADNHSSSADARN